MRGVNNTVLGQKEPFTDQSYARLSQFPVSKMEKIGQEIRGYPLLITLLTMGLLAEWLHPLQNFMKPSTHPFFVPFLYLMTALLLLIGWISKRTAVTVSLQLSTMILVWYFLCSGENWAVWLPVYLIQLQDDAAVFLQDYSIAGLSLETRTWIVMLGWGIFTSCVHAVALYLRSILLLGVLTVFYLLCLEAMAGLSVYTGMVRVVLLLAVLQGVIHLTRLGTQPSMPQWKHGLGWFLTASVLVVATAALSIQAVRFADVPAASPHALDQLVVKLHSWQGRSSERSLSQTAVTGYGEGMQDMGESLKPDYTPVFTADSPVSTYWKGESYSFYTGRRWEEPYAQWQSEEVGKQYIADPYVEEDGSRAVVVHESEEVLTSPSIIQRVHYMDPVMTGLPLFAGGTITKVIDVESHQETRQPIVYRDQASEAVKLPVVTPAEAITGYVIETRLNAVLPDRLPPDDAGDPSWVTDRYLQLPDTLPQRVKQLASELIADSPSRYHAVLSVQSYLEENYRYTLNTQVPAPNQEFTDHFLFESREGYCNHFSTAMVVLLRSQGIPARFVKGYAPGQVSESDPTKFVITQADAHSWVEVYFPDAGWAAFDPTPGFAMNSRSGSTTEWILAKSYPALAVLQAEVGQLGNRGLAYLSEVAAQVRGMLRANWILLLGFMAVLCCVSMSLMMLYRSRDYFLLLRLYYGSRRSFPSKDQLVHAGMLVWQAVSRHYGGAADGMTAREYTDSLDIPEGKLSAEFAAFAQQWESVRYGEEITDRSTSKVYLKRCLQIVRSLP